jgi:predicted outer membrane repeat protein
LTGGAGGGIANTTSGVLTISTSTVSGNSANSAGGGIENEGTLIISGSTLEGNSAQSGGGIFSYGDVSISSSTMSANNATLFGGGIFDINAIGGTVTVSTSTFVGNTAGSNGGAIDNRGDLTLSTSTFNANKAPLGGAISNVGGGVTLTMTASTVSGNAAVDGGGIHNFTATAIVGSSIVADNTATTAGNDCTGAPTSSGYNLIGDADGCSFVATAGDQVGSASGSGEIDPILGPLANNGGPTQTMALGLSSPADDAIPAGTTLCPTAGTTDQRGMSRPAGTTCDIGAYELKPWISRVTIDSGVAAAPSVSGTIACQMGTPFTIAITLKQGPSSGTGSTTGTCGGSAPVAWTASVSGGTFVPGVAQASFKATASTGKDKGKLQVVLV